MNPVSPNRYNPFISESILILFHVLLSSELSVLSVLFPMKLRTFLSPRMRTTYVLRTSASLTV